MFLRPGFKRIRRLAGLVVIALGLFWVVFFFAQASLIFRTDRVIHATPSAHGWAFEDVQLQGDGETTHGWFVPVDAPRGTVLYCHGNDGNISQRLGEIAMFRELGFSVFIYDYGGFGKSTGSPSEKRMYADATAAWDYLVDTRAIAPARIVLWGSSFGGPAACDLASRVTPGAVVLEATFVSMAEAAFGAYGAIPGRLLLRHRFENLKKIPRLTAPLLVIHSREDSLYPFEHGKRLFDAAPEPKQFLEVTGDHGERAGGKYAPGVNAFLDAYFLR